MEAKQPVWLVTGAGGMLGTEMVLALRRRGASVTALKRTDVDISDANAVAEIINGVTYVVNCAAYTAVDAAETDEQAARSANADGPGKLARACLASGAALIHFSTDYVFAGDALEPYSEDAATAPVGAYGRTKADGERQIMESGARAWVVRTAWLYGAHGPCFPKTIARVGAERGSVAVVDDQLGQPTWTRDLAEFVLRLVDADAPAGIYHGTSGGRASWYEFAREVTKSAGLGDIVTPTTSAEFVRPAPRPAWSVLGHDATLRVGVEPIGHWKQRWSEAASEVLAAHA